TKDNALYFIECKSLDQHDDKDLNALYKVGALQRDFGLRVKSFFLTTSPHVLKNGEIRPSIKARAEQLNTEVIPNFDVKNLSAIIKRKLNIT
ncbi:MAG: DUF1887 family CARF protein, partial [Thermodesulfovibrionales bacterium]|nr:DUF1887 family CARF protein [Thermodesulfovibrionales bacterium]